MHVALPVALGAAVYLLWRAPHLRVFRWAEAVRADAAVERLRAWAAGARPHLPEAFLFSLPDALWVYALTAALALVWRRERGPAAAAWLAVGPLLGVGSELGQRAGMVPGTFDPLDAALCALAAGLAWLLVYRRPAETACAAV